MRAAGRSVLAVVLGLVAAFVAVLALNMVSYAVYPPPPGFDFNNPEALKSLASKMPVGALLFVLLAETAGAFVGPWVAARVARRSFFVHGLIVGTLFLLLDIRNLATLPHPLWFWIVSIAGAAIAAYFGSKLGACRRPPVLDRKPALAGV
jgi:uncharacterized protein YacL